MLPNASSGCPSSCHPNQSHQYRYLEQREREVARSRLVGQARTKAQALAQFRLLKRNVYVGRRPASWDKDDMPMCNCKPIPSDAPEVVRGCDEFCLNRQLLVECAPETCPCGDRCTNQVRRARRV